MKKVFISYCSKDQKLVKCFIEFLQLGMGMDKSTIFCTVYPEMLETGESFIENIQKRLYECDAMISIITQEYLNSKFCLLEMGAAWALSKKKFPIVTVPYDMLIGTPFQDLQMRKIDSVEDMSVIYDELHKCNILEEFQTAEFNKRVVDFVNEIRKIIYKGTKESIEKDTNGYYETDIISVRTITDKKYRCYRIRGKIANPPDNQQADSDWLFYFATAFPELQVGDKVRFKTSKTKVKYFSDLGYARNIYPDDLKKL